MAIKKDFISLNFRRLLILALFGFQCSTVHSQTLTILFAGDVMQHKSQIDNAYRQGVYDYSSSFKYLKESISEADISVVNLEAVLGGKPYTGYPMFSAPDMYAVALKDAGFNVFLTANNHCLDRGRKGLERTIGVLDSLDVKHLGTYKDREERVRNYPMMLVKKGIRIAFLNYTYGTNGVNVVPPNVVNYIDTIQIKKDIQDANDFLKADWIVACVHWGMEYTLIQSKEQERLAEWMTKEGVDMIIGSHPHVVQPSRALRNEQGEITNVIVYSLGNFISGMTQIDTDGGQLIKVVLSKENFTTKIISCSYRLVYVDKQPHGNKIDYTLLPVKAFENRKDSIASHSYNKMMIFTKRARNLFAKYNDREIKEEEEKTEENAVEQAPVIPTWIPAPYFR